MPETPDTHGRAGSLTPITHEVRSTGTEIPVTADEDAAWREIEQARIDKARAERER